MNDSLGDRMKAFENLNRGYLIPKIPVIMRLDGRAFHTFTRNAIKPYDERVMSAMTLTALKLMEEIQGAKLAYTQSDEISILICDTDRRESQGWFDYNIQKMVSISAAFASVEFWKIINFTEMVNWGTPLFDSRVFNIPAHDVENYFLWRNIDWHRNSVQMLAQSLFSHKELQGKKISDIHEMLHGIGKNWANESERAKNGTWIMKCGETFEYNYMKFSDEMRLTIREMVAVNTESGNKE